MLQNTEEEFEIHERWFTLKDQEIVEPAQRSPEWFARRKGKLSGSKLSQFLFIKSQEDRVKFYEEVFEGRKRDPFTAEQQSWMSWGTKHEDTAMRILLTNVQNMYGMEAPMVQHSSIQWLASSPDGFYEFFDDSGAVYEQGVVEIKCPAKTKKATKKPTYYYIMQTYLEMACSGRDKVIFCSWGKDKCRAWRMTWDDELWGVLSTLIHDFRVTKTDKALSFDDWKLLQYRLLEACHRICDEATPLHEGDGWDSEYVE